MKLKHKPFIKVTGFFLLVYLVLHIFPEILFRHKTEFKSFKIFSHQPLQQNTFAIIDKAEGLVGASEFYQKPIHQKIFICDSFLEYFFFAPGAGKAFAVNHTLSGNIFIAKADFEQNKSYRNDKLHAERSLTGVLAHETTHSLLFNQLGFIKHTALETWKKEGYCDFIANESTMTATEGSKLLCSENRARNNTFDYFKYRLLVEYLIKDKKLSADELIDKEFDLPELTNDLRIKHCSKSD